MKIEVGKIYLTASGRKVRILCTDAKGQQPVIGVDEENGDAITYRHDGKYYSASVDSALDLVSEYVEPPKPREVRICEYADGSLSEYTGTALGPGSRLVLFREVIE